MTCPFFAGVCTYTVAARPDTAVVVVVNVPVQAVVIVVNETVAGAVWTGATEVVDEDEVVGATEEDEEEDATDEDEDDLVDDEAIEDDEDEETTEADEEVEEVLEATEEAEEDDEETELDEEDEETELEEEATLEEGATLDEEEGSRLARPDTIDVGRGAILNDDEGRTTAGQLMAFELMLSATLVRLKYASMLRIFNTLSAAGGP